MAGTTSTEPQRVTVARREADRFTQLERKLLAYRPAKDTRLLRRAFELAAERHAHQKRKSGEPYLSHPLEVAHILADMQLDEPTLVSGLLHDTVEDTSATLGLIRREFGSDIARCVDGVTKIGRLRFQSTEARQAGTFRKMLLAMVKDIRVILIKLADRVHNMRTLRALDRDRQRRIALETRQIYAPVALRLGMGKVRSELEDLAFSYLEPHAYRTIVRQIESRREATEEFLAEIQRELKGKLAEAGIPSRLEGRIKRPYSIHQKLHRQKVTFDMVYDLLALRVITDTKTHCYAAMGVIHGQWHPVPSRIRDFVAMPRPNLYQSLHTSVVTRGGQRFEVQIRTEKMHRMAEEGICAHWKYKEGISGADVSDGQMAWLRRLVEWQREVKDSTDFLSTLKIELYPEEVYVFTPKGKVITLPRDATPVDFAYAIHTEVGHTCSGARVDGQIAPLKRPLRNGEIVEVITQSGGHPSQDWLSFVKTSRARNKIKQWLNARRRGRAIEIGHRLLEKEARAAKVPLRQVQPERLAEVCREYGCSTPDDLYARLGFGRFSVRQVVRKLFPEGTVPDPAQLRSKPPVIDTAGSRSAADVDATLEVRGVDDILIYRARCCNPILGEQITGYVTRGKGVAVHSTTCRNVQNLMFESERRIDVRWAPKEGLQYQARLTVDVNDRRGVLKDLTSVITNEGLNIVKVKSRSSRTGDRARVSFVVEVADKRQLERVAAALGRMDAVREVFRSGRL
jgi:GTP pyrophosphokinase